MQDVSATFSAPMDPLTITAPGTFTLAVAGANGAAVTGTVTYDSQTNIATFTPTANLTANTQYTATVTNAAQDLSGNALAAGLVPNPWNFTTGSAAGPVGPNLASAQPFGAFGGGAGITNQGINTVINGDIGTTGASTLVTGFHDHGARMHLHGNATQRWSREWKYRHRSSAADSWLPIGRHCRYCRHRATSGTRCSRGL